MPDYYPTPTVSPFDDITDYVALLLGVCEDYLDLDSVWAEGEAETAQGYIEDLKRYLTELPNMVIFPLGGILPYAGDALPDNFLWCDGGEYLVADFPELAAALYGAFIDGANFNVPDLTNRFIKGWNAGGTDDTGDAGGEAAHTLTTAEMPSHNHTQNSHNHTQDSHNHTQNSHNHTQDSHNHTQNSHNHTQDAHGHTVNDPGHSHVVFGRSNATGFGISNRAARADSGGTDSNLAANSGTTGITNASTTATNQAATATNNATTATNQAATATNNATTATNQAATATNNAAGGDGAHNNMPPWLGLRYIIRAL